MQYVGYAYTKNSSFLSQILIYLGIMYFYLLNWEAL